MISESKFVVVDFETTGLVPALDKIIEIGAVKVQNGKIIDEFQTLINPNVFVPAEVTSITGIGTEMLKDSPVFSEIADNFLNFLETESIFVAHNVQFDFDFLNASLQRENRSSLENPYLCTIDLSKRIFPDLGKYNLGALASLFGIELPCAHRALYDARATASLLAHLINTLQNRGIKYLHEIPTIRNLKVSKSKPESTDQIALF